MKRYVLIVLLSVVRIYAQTQELSLDKSIEIGLKNSKELKIAYARQISADARVTEATSQMLPQLKFQAGYTRLSEVPAFDIRSIIPIGQFGSPLILFPSIENNYMLRLSLQQPIFTGFRLSSMRSAAKLNSSAANIEVIRDLNEAAFKIQTAFWNYYKAQQILKLLNENLEQLTKHLEDTRNFLENGLVTENDLLKLEVQYSNTKLQHIEAQNTKDITKMAFNQILGLSLTADTEIAVNPINPDLQNYDFNGLLKEAKENRSDLIAMKFRKEAGEKMVSAARSGWFPQLFLSSNFYYSRPNQRILPPHDKFEDTWDVGVTLSWDIWNWNYTSSQSIQAEQSMVQTETALAQLTDVVDIEVSQNYLSYQRSKEKIDVSNKALGQAKENYRTTNEKYNVQLATSTDLIDAEASVMQAETNYINSLVDYELAKVRLEKSVGRKIY